MSNKGRIEVDMDMDLSKVGVQPLMLMKTAIEEEIDVIRESLANLKIAHSKLLESKDCVDKITPGDKGRSFLIPLTSSVYVGGTLTTPEDLLIAIGADYLVGMTSRAASDYLERKVTFVTGEMNKVDEMGLEKSKERAVILEVLQMKLQELTTTPAK